MDKLCETINRQCCLHCEMECDGKWLETEIEMYKEDLLKKQADKIADLEAKLAESEERVVELSDGIRKLEEVKDSKIKGVRDFWMKRYEQKLKKYDKENKQLKQQLAEKEKEVEVMKQMLVDREETIIVVEKSNKGLILNYNQLKKQLDEMKKKKNYYKKKHKETLELKVDNQNQTAIAELKGEK